jgi:hypothetical protein
LKNPTDKTLMAFCSDWSQHNLYGLRWFDERCLLEYLCEAKQLRFPKCDDLCIRLMEERVEHSGYALCYMAKHPDIIMEAWKHNPSAFILDLIALKAYVESLEESSHGQIHANPNEGTHENKSSSNVTVK